MAHQQVIVGTSEEIVALLQAGTFAGQMMRLIIEADAEDLTDNLPDPPNTVRNMAHLEQLLLEGLASATHEVTEETWEEMRREVRRRHAARQQ